MNTSTTNKEMEIEMFSQQDLDENQPENMPFVTILDDSENYTATWFATLAEAEEYNNNAPTESQVYVGRSVDFSLYY